MSFKKKLIGLSALIMSTVLCFSACEEEGGMSQTPQAEGFRLSYYDGTDVEQYDSDLLWMNTSEVANDGAGDGDVFYVSKEEDPVNGGYFYMYSTKNGGVPTTTPTETYYPYVLTSRSKDMIDWEMCGEVDGCYSLKLTTDTWVQSNMYAPEVIRNPEDGLYYMYYTAASKVNNTSLRQQGAKYSASSNWYDRCYIGVAVSSSPCGPFLPCTSEVYYGDANWANDNGTVLTRINPTILLDEECDELFYTDSFTGQDEIFSIIDVSPFIDDDGILYLYFARHTSSNNPIGHCVWGMKMKDMVTPDYTTLTCLFRGTYLTANTEACMLGNADATPGKKFVRTEYAGEGQVDPAYPRHLGRSWKSYTTYEDGTESTDGQQEYNLVEAPNMITTKDKDGKKVYVMSYAPIGVDRVQGDYDCKAAYSYDPLNGFIKPNPEDGAFILAVDTSVNDYMSNLGHISFVTAGDEVWIAHWERQAPFTGLDQGRLYALSSCSFQLMENTGIYMPVANGPTKSLQVKPEVSTGYTNVAKNATITVKNGKSGTEKYLNDGMWVTHGVNSDKEFVANNETDTVEITLTFNQPTTVRGLLVFNSYSTDHAFTNISLVQFNLAETPSWHSGDEKACFIDNLPYNQDAYMTEKGLFQPGSAAVATFNEMKVNSITIKIAASDLYVAGELLRVSEIFVIGK